MTCENCRCNCDGEKIIKLNRGQVTQLATLAKNGAERVKIRRYESDVNYHANIFFQNGKNILLIILAKMLFGKYARTYGEAVDLAKDEADQNLESDRYWDVNNVMRIADQWLVAVDRLTLMNEFELSEYHFNELREWVAAK